MSPLCHLNGGLKPSLWQEEVVKTYQMVNESLPDYIEVLLNIAQGAIFPILQKNKFVM